MRKFRCAVLWHVSEARLLVRDAPHLGGAGEVGVSNTRMPVSVRYNTHPDRDDLMSLSPALLFSKLMNS